MGLPPQRGGYKRPLSIGLFVSSVAQNISHSNFGGNKTRFAQTVSPLSEILAPFLTPDTMPVVTDPLICIVSLALFHIREPPLSPIHFDTCDCPALC